MTCELKFLLTVVKHTNAQIICSHVKVLKDVSHSAYVPPLKKALEIVIYQVKMLLIENRVPQSAFFMGALKHRDIKGDEVSSQVRTMSFQLFMLNELKLTLCFLLDSKRHVR